MEKATKAVMDKIAASRRAEAEAEKMVKEMPDESVMACFGCCPPDPSQAREILKNQFYNELLQEYNDGVMENE